MHPVVIGAADRGRELRIHVVARQERQAGRREQHGDVNPLQFHPHDLRLGVIAALDRKHHVRVGALRDERAADAVVLRSVAVVAGRGAVEEPQRAPAHAGRAAVDPAQRRGDARFELGVEVFLEQIGRLHDVHVAIDKPMALFHLRLPSVVRPRGMGTSQPVPASARRSVKRQSAGCQRDARLLCS